MTQHRLDHEEPRLRRYSIVIDKEESPLAKIRVVGIGGGGCNAIDSMIRRGLTGVDFIAINTDAQVLERNPAPHKIQIGRTITKGLGAGGDVIVGQKAMEEDRDKVASALADSDMVFVTTGLGGGTGTGGSPILASIARSSGALVVGIVTKPFKWEGGPRMQNAEKGLSALKDHVDSLIVIPNERLFAIIDKKASCFDIFDKPNEVLYDATKGISDVIIKKGVINVDFADIRTAMRQGGDTLMGCGRAKGESKATEAAQRAITSPLLEGLDIRGSRNVLVNITGSSNLSMDEVQTAMITITEAVGENAYVKFGVVHDESLNDEVMITVIATGYSKVNKLIPEMPIIELQTRRQIIAIESTQGLIDSYSTDKLDELNRPSYKRAGANIHSEIPFPDSNAESFTKNFKEVSDAEEDVSQKSALLRKMMD